MKSNTTIIFLITLLVAAGAYWYFFTGTGNEPPLSTESAPTNQAQMRFETLVGELESISFNTKVFSDTRFNALVDIATPVAPESIGRLDPLAPISARQAVTNPVIPNPVTSGAGFGSGTSSPVTGIQ
jgi:hypothetical protein